MAIPSIQLLALAKVIIHSKWILIHLCGGEGGCEGGGEGEGGGE